MIYKPLVERIGMSLCACGGCCSSPYPCDKCVERTLLSNGIPVSEVESFKGLSHRPADYSELGNAVRRRLSER